MSWEPCSPTPSPSPSPSRSRSTCRAHRVVIGLIPVLILILSLTTIYVLSQRVFHSMDDGSSLRIPRSLDDVRMWSNVLSRARAGAQPRHLASVTNPANDSTTIHELTTHSTSINTDPSDSDSATSTSTHMSLVSFLLISSRDRDILILFALAFLVKQAFAIPGSSLLNVLAGALYAYWGWPLVCLLTATGASCCYGLSYAFGGASLARYLFSESRIAHMTELVAQQNKQHSLFWFCLSLRLFPFAPNFFLNFASPIIGVPFTTFFFSVLFGLAPYCFICVRSGVFLSQLSSMDAVMDVSNIMSMLAVSGVALVPVLISYYHHKDTLRQATGTATPTPPKTTHLTNMEPPHKQEPEQKQKQEQQRKPCKITPRKSRTRSNISISS